MKESIVGFIFSIGVLVGSVLVFGSIDYLLSFIPGLGPTQSKALIVFILSFCGLLYVIYLLHKNVLNYTEMFIHYKSSGEFMLHVIGLTLFSMLIFRSIDELIFIDLSMLYIGMQIMFWLSIVVMLYHLFVTDNKNRMPTE